MEECGDFSGDHSDEASWKLHQVCPSVWFGHQAVGVGQPRQLSCLVTRCRELSRPSLTSVLFLLPPVLEPTVKKSPRVASLRAGLQRRVKP